MAKSINRHRMSHPAPLSRPHGVRPKTGRIHGVTAWGEAGGAVWGNLGWRVYKIEAVSILGSLQPEFPKFGPTSPNQLAARLSSLCRHISLKSKSLFGGTSFRAPYRSLLNHAAPDCSPLRAPSARALDGRSGAIYMLNWSIKLNNYFVAMCMPIAASAWPADSTKIRGNACQ